jgi:hypothetical protein
MDSVENTIPAELKVRDAGKVERTVRSGGPRSREGKAAASKNSIKTGAFSGLTVLPGESEEEFEVFVSKVVRDCQAIGPMEQALAERLAQICWKQKRIGRLEQVAALSATARPITIPELKFAGLVVPQGAEASINSRPMDAEEFDAFKLFVELIMGHIHERKIAKEDVESIQKDIPAIYELIVVSAHNLGLQDPTPESLANATIGSSEGNREPLLLQVYEKVAVGFQGALWVTLNHAKLEETKQRVRDKRIFDLIRSERTSRANDYLSKEFLRTLAELRKQQDWRLKQAIDVTPVRSAN